MRRAEAAIPARSWAYPLYDLALIGWMLGAAPIIGSIILGRPHVAAIAIGALILISVSAVVLGKRDGITVAGYFDSSKSRS